MIKRPIFVVACFYICGLILGRFLIPPLWLIAPVLFICIAAAAACFTFSRTRPATQSVVVGLIVLSFFLLGIIRENETARERLAFRNQIAYLETAPSLNISGRVAQLPQHREEKTLVVLKNTVCELDQERLPLIGKLQVVLTGDALRKIREWGNLQQDDLLRVRGTIKKPLSRRNPTLFNYTAYLENRGIGGIVRCYNPSSILGIEKAAGYNPFRTFVNLAGSYRIKCEQLFLRSVPGEKGGILAGMFLGASYYLDTTERDSFQKAGVMHFFAVSGLHTGLIALLIYLILTLLRIPLPLRSILTILLIVFMAAFTGFKASVVRAAVMIVCLLLSPLLKRDVEPINALAIAAFLVLMVNPSALREASFQLSYTAVLFIIILSPVFKEVLLFTLKNYPLHKRGQLARVNTFLLRPFSITLSVTLGLAPLLAHYFHIIPLLTPITHLLFGVLGFLIITCGFLLATLGFLFPPLILPVAYCASGAITVFESLARGISSISWSAISVPSFPFYLVALYYSVLLTARGIHIIEPKSVLMVPQRKFRLLFAVLASLTVLIWTPLVTAWTGQNRLFVYMLDVGQGDALYLEFPDGANMLIDGGSAYPLDSGKNTVLPFLKSRGVDEIEVVVATHPDSDHSGGLKSVIEDVFVNLLITNGQKAGTKSWQSLEKTVENTATMTRAAKRGMKIAGFERAQIRILNPDDLTLQTFDRNNNSVVMKVDYGDVSLLFTGDLGYNGEHHLLDLHTKLRSQVLKVAHHGSRDSTSEPFLRAVKPGNGKPFVALVSVGEHNRFEHPAPSTITRLESAGAAIYRTDRDGAVCIITDGKRIGTKKFSYE